MTFPGDLQSGDVLLYSRSGIYDDLIKLKTWSNVTHVEIFLDTTRTAASRPGKGVAVYDFDQSGLVMVRRYLKAPFSVENASRWMEPLIGLPYDYEDLLRFFSMQDNSTGIVCSPFATMCLRAGSGCQAFAPDYDDRAIAPRDFLTSAELRPIWSAT